MKVLGIKNFKSENFKKYLNIVYLKAHRFCAVNGVL